MRAKRAVILCAGESKRLKPLTENTPKSLLDVNGTSFLYRHFKNLEKCEIEEVVLVVGFEKEKIVEAVNNYKTKKLKIKVVENNDWKDTNNGYSLYLGLNNVPISESIVIINADVICHYKLIDELISNNYRNAFACQKKKEIDPEEMKVIVNQFTQYVDHISKDITHYSFGEFTGICKIEDVAEIKLELGKEENRKEWFEKSLDNMIRRQEIKFRIVDVTHYPSLEVDFAEDLEEARDIFPSYETAEWEWGIRHESLTAGKRVEADAVSLLSDFVDLLEQYNIKYWLNWGTLLGFYRDKRFIPWDTDIDVTFHEERYEKVIDFIVPYMKERGCFVPDLKKNETGDLWFIRDKEKIEFNYVKSVEDKYIYAPGRCDLGCPKSYIDKLDTVNVYGRDWKIPSNTEEYLRLSYGDNWKTPIRYDGTNYYECKPKSL